ncbi:MAG: DUF5011 domain-containing protein, partial [Acholeplasmataceae bacterium]|nr:DUF5011 domain-containing protein [Acholeplasmataceae bacterium]
VAAYDNVDGNITTSIIVDDSDVNLEEVGVYSLVYSVVDSSDNLSTTSVSVSVLPGNQPIDVNIPVIIGYSHIKHVFGDSEPNYLEGVTAFDIEDGYITENIVLDISNVDLNTLGVYTVTYSIEDEAKNFFQASIELTVVDETEPVISGVEDMVYHLGDDLPNFLEGVTAIDDYDGDISHLIIVDSSDFDDWFEGTYNIIYTVSDSSDNQTTYIRKINVVDGTAPSIINASDINFFVGDSIPNYLNGVSALDNIDGNVTNELQFDDESVNYDVPGTYQVTLFVVDSSNNLASILITVTVIDHIAPVIHGTQQYTYTIGDEIPDLLLGVTATDNVDDDLTQHIEVIEEIDYETADVYTVTYVVFDSSENQATVTVSFTVISNDSIDLINNLNVYYINDTHGAILENDDEMGMAKIGNLIKNEKVVNPESTLFIGGGDLLQGSLISNYFNGASMIEILNELEMDAFVIGNHEFDWGIEIVTNYRDPQNSLMYAEFPLLGANLFIEGTTIRPEYIDAYTIVQKGQVKVGIIGLIGYGLESSIATSRVSGYEFAQPTYWAEYYTEYLRTVEDVDMVLVVLHDPGQSGSFNQTLSTWTGDRKVDAVFNGHSHQTYVNMYNRTGADMPNIQSSANGKRVGKVSFVVDESANIISASAINLLGSNEQKLLTAHPGIQAIVDSYVNQIEPLLNDVIIYSGEYVSQSQLTYYMSELIREATNSDIAFHNLGGTRDSIANGEAITVAKLYKIFPFDNRIKTVELTGAQINSYVSAYGGYNSIRDGITSFESSTYYKVATNDYIFDQESNPFINGNNIVDTGILIRDILETVLRNQAELGLTFSINNTIQVSSSYSQNLWYVDFKKTYDFPYVS